MSEGFFCGEHDRVNPGRLASGDCCPEDPVVGVDDKRCSVMLG